jgi:recombination protein RecR
MSISPILDNLSRALTALPGVGRRSANRHALYLLQNRDDAAQLISTLSQALEKLSPCSKCRNLCEGELCSICQDPYRSCETLCVVERLADLQAFERGGAYRGRYFVLGGVLSPLDGVGPEQLGIPDLLRLCHTENVSEVILAMGSSSEGEATAHFLDQALGASAVRRTRLARGIPMGAELEYMDENTLSRALEARSTI